METKIFVNIPVKDLKKSMAFFSELGFNYDYEFTNDDAACMIIGKENYVMLLTEPFFKNFTKKEIPDPSKSAEVIIALSAESKEKVKDIVSKALKAGGKNYSEPMDYGFMYQESFQDLDGHLWEIIYMEQAEKNAKSESVTTSDAR